MRDDENTQLCQTSREGRPWPRKRPGSTLRPPRPWPCRPEGRRAGAKGPQGLSVPCCDPPVTGEAAGQAGPGPGRCPVLLSSEAAHGAVLPAGRPKGPGCWLRAGCVSPGACGTRAGPRQWMAALAGHVRQASAPLPGAKVTAQVTLSRSVVVGGTRLCPRSRGHLHPGGWRSQSPEDGSRPRGAWKTCAPPCTDTAPRSRTTPPAKTKIHAERTGFSEPFSLRRTTTSRRPRVGGRPGPPRGRRAGPPGRNAGDGGTVGRDTSAGPGWAPSGILGPPWSQEGVCPQSWRGRGPGTPCSEDLKVSPANPATTRTAWGVTWAPLSGFAGPPRPACGGCPWLWVSLKHGASGHPYTSALAACRPGETRVPPNSARGTARLPPPAASGAPLCTQAPPAAAPSVGGGTEARVERGVGPLPAAPGPVPGAHGAVAARSPRASSGRGDGAAPAPRRWIRSE